VTNIGSAATRTGNHIPPRRRGRENGDQALS
jgi:hypothetical protein